MKATFKPMMISLAVTLLAACGGNTWTDGTSGVVESDFESTEQAITCSNAPSCGTTLTTLDNIPAKSNGSYMQTGSSCAGSGTYGLQYQCVEYARRYWNQVRGKTFGGVTYACNICDLTPNGWTKYSGTSTYIPVKGDLFIKPCVSGGPGHVGVVVSATSTSVTVAEQNASCSGRSTYSKSSALCILH